ncbi:tRNA (N(6)-L-threonylcarbamoyladenosine(37)-C(2))-methylthiotransferase MtaB [Curvivirga sp.]|uniref:tRNA (N(6)-L-threonylcarbamoyladenosine(37)-C(2))- methylthiotransferase MtaB n=1 Tax=Curvivirga sp. TaxID=2856848 RepID=UPI003B5C4E5D
MVSDINTNPPEAENGTDDPIQPRPVEEHVDNNLDIVTFGCRLNSYESEVMRDNARKAGLEDAIIFNTCAVTSEAERQARQAIRRAARNNPNAKIIVTGCAAQVNSNQFAEMPEVSKVIGNMEKLEQESFNPASFGIEASEKVQVNDIMSVKETANHLVAGFEGRARAFVQVQNGCDHRCTFCIIPYGRGNSRSVPMGEITQQVKSLVENGYKEIVLTGVDITSYGADLPGTPSLGQMVRRLLQAVPELPRLRISSIDCIEMDEDLFDVIANEPRLMPHLHLSLQAGDDMILKRMKRRHGRQDAIDLCKRLRNIRPDIVFGADLIAGFPTETDEMFENTLKTVEECGLLYLHVFPYSERPGTPAARIPNQVPKNIRKERAQKIREAGKLQEAKYLESCIGTEAQVLFERNGLGRNEQFACVKLSIDVPDGTLLNVKITGRDGITLIGEPIES